jgi:hypothetical protein
VTQLPMLTAEGTAPAERGRVHVHFGDWREVEPSWPRPFVFVSDVPYGIAYESGWPRPDSLPASIRGDTDTAERNAMLAVPGWQAAAVFGPADLLAVPPWGKPRAVLIMDKGENAGMGDLAFPWRPNYETIAIYGTGWTGKRTTSVLRHNVASSAAQGRRHPHQKDERTMVELIAKAPPGLPIVDPFLGSGTTAVACALLGREFYGAEIDPQYFDVIRGRLAAVGVHLP